MIESVTSDCKDSLCHWAQGAWGSRVSVLVINYIAVFISATF